MLTSTYGEKKRQGEGPSVRGEQSAIDKANQEVQTSKLPTAERFSSTINLSSRAGRVGVMSRKTEMPARSAAAP